MWSERKLARNKNHILTFSEGICHDMDIQRKLLLGLKKNVKTGTEKLCEVMMSSVPKAILNTKLKDLPNVSSYQCIRESENYVSHKQNGHKEGQNQCIPNTMRKLEDNVKNMFVTSCEKTVPTHVITPKVAPNSQAAVLRFPFRDEFAVSAAGSPLQVSCFGGDTASITIPLKNGKVMALLPVPGLNTDVIEENLEPTVKKQLETLQSAISRILVRSEVGE